MARIAGKRRGNEDWPWRGDTSNTLAHIPNRLRAEVPKLGRGFMEGDPRGRQEDGALTVGSYLLGKLGTRGYGRMLQRANEAAVKPKRRRHRPRRKAVAA